MAYSQGNTILDTDFNTMVDNVNRVLGSGAGDRGYGQTPIPASTKVANAETITASEWRTLYSKVNDILEHQTGTANTLTLPTTNSVISYSSGLATALGNIEGNRLNFGAGQTSTNLEAISSRTERWQGPIKHVFTAGYSANSANSLRYFFNTGGAVYIDLGYTGTSGTAPIDIAWKNAIDAINTIQFDHDSTTSVDITISSFSTFSNIGYYDLTSSLQRIYTYDDSGNDIHIKVSARIVSSKIEFTMELDSPETAGTIVNLDVSSTIGYRVSLSPISVSQPSFTTTTGLGTGGDVTLVVSLNDIGQAGSCTITSGDECTAPVAAGKWTATPIGNIGTTEYQWKLNGGAYSAKSTSNKSPAYGIVDSNGTSSHTIEVKLSSNGLVATDTDAFTTKHTLPAFALGSIEESGSGSCTVTESACKATTTYTVIKSGGSGTPTYAWTVGSGATIESGQGTSSITVSTTSSSTSDKTFEVDVSATDDAGQIANTNAITGRHTRSYPAFSLGTIMESGSGSCTISGSACKATTTYTVIKSGGVGTPAYTWTVGSGATIESGQGTSSITVSTTSSSTSDKTFSVDVSATDDAGQIADTNAITGTHTRSIPAFNLSAITETSSVGCDIDGGNCTATSGYAVTATGGAGTITYVWSVKSGAASIQGSNTNSTVAVTSSNTNTTTSFTMEVVASDANGSVTKTYNATHSRTKTAFTLNDIVRTSAGDCDVNNGASCTATSAYSVSVKSGGLSISGYTWSVSGGGATISTGTGNTATVTTSNNNDGNTNFTVSVTATDRDGTTPAKTRADTHTRELIYDNINASIATYGTEDTSCEMNGSSSCTVSNQYSASATGGDGSYSYAWTTTTSGITIENATTSRCRVKSTRTSLTSTPFTLKLTVSDNSGNNGTSTKSITYSATVSAVTASIALASGSSNCSINGAPSCNIAQTYTATGSGGSGSYAYKWTKSGDGGGVNLSNSTSKTCSLSATRTSTEDLDFTLTLVVTDALDSNVDDDATTSITYYAGITPVVCTIARDGAEGECDLNVASPCTASTKYIATATGGKTPYTYAWGKTHATTGMTITTSNGGKNATITSSHADDVGYTIWCTATGAYTAGGTSNSDKSDIVPGTQERIPLLAVGNLTMTQTTNPAGSCDLISVAFCTSATAFEVNRPANATGTVSYNWWAYETNNTGNSVSVVENAESATVNPRHTDTNALSVTVHCTASGNDNGGPWTRTTSKVYTSTAVDSTPAAPTVNLTPGTYTLSNTSSSSSGNVNVSMTYRTDGNMSWQGYFDGGTSDEPDNGWLGTASGTGVDASQYAVIIENERDNTGLSRSVGTNDISFTAKPLSANRSINYYKSGGVGSASVTVTVKCYEIANPSNASYTTYNLAARYVG